MTVASIVRKYFLENWSVNFLFPCYAVYTTVIFLVAVVYWWRGKDLRVVGHFSKRAVFIPYVYTFTLDIACVVCVCVCVCGWVCGCMRVCVGCTCVYDV